MIHEAYDFRGRVAIELVPTRFDRHGLRDDTAPVRAVSRRLARTGFAPGRGVSVERIIIRSS